MRRGIGKSFSPRKGKAVPAVLLSLLLAISSFSPASFLMASETEGEPFSEGLEREEGSSMTEADLPAALTTETETEADPLTLAMEAAGDYIMSDRPSADMQGAAEILVLSHALPPRAEEKLKAMDYEEIQELMQACYVLVQSEEFKSLMSYQEVRDLILILLEKSAQLMVEDPELSEKILETAGVDEDAVYLLLFILQKGEDLGPALQMAKESEMGQAILAYMQEYYEADELNEALEELCLGLEEVYGQGDGAFAEEEESLTETEAGSAAYSESEENG